MGLFTTKNVFLIIVVLLPCLSTTYTAQQDDSKSKAIRPFYVSSTSDYRLSTYATTVHEAYIDCQNLTNARRTYSLIILNDTAEESAIIRQLRLPNFDVKSVWTAGYKSSKSPIFSLSGSNETMPSNPRMRRSSLQKPIVKTNNPPYPLTPSPLHQESVVNNRTITSKCKRIAPENCRTRNCTVKLLECSIKTPNCTADSKPECIATRPDCSARCENCTIAVPPQCYVQTHNCTVETPKNCIVTNSTECTVETPPCTVKRPECPAPDPIDCFTVSTPAPCTTRQPCIRNDSCVGGDCKCPVEICQVKETICPQPEVNCAPPNVTCPDPIIRCADKPTVVCDPPKVHCPKPTVVCTEAQVSCLSPIVNCPAIITTCMPPKVTCLPPILQCPPPIVECEKPDGNCEPVSTPEPCVDETTTTEPPTITTEPPCPPGYCGCHVMRKSEDYKEWIGMSCTSKHRFICEAPL